ncbi:hypothetical protein CAOG_009544 [Capsaspora owczarzaki ATCC 30864]|uniref:Uncharacterized protein n=1 Tax=Capsaspora owczarzaki (strain ATCC 30864) TaxID=595528 RepID=A0A0D2WL83_CAPO3|nr:hypothetical protein CAOG_009544 [Capsaspora owczarzaki ATCC 30864]
MQCVVLDAVEVLVALAAVRHKTHVLFLGAVDDANVVENKFVGEPMRFLAERASCAARPTTQVITVLATASGLTTRSCSHQLSHSRRCRKLRVVGIVAVLVLLLFAEIKVLWIAELVVV